MQTGFLAQEVYSVFPQAASKGGKDPVQDPWSVAPMELIPLLVNGMQEQQSMIEKQQGLIEELQQAVEILKANQK